MVAGTVVVAVTVAVAVVAVVAMLEGPGEVSGEVSRLCVAGAEAGADVDAIRLVGSEGGGVRLVGLSAAREVDVELMPTWEVRWLNIEGEPSGLELMCWSLLEDRSRAALVVDDGDVV